MNQREREHQIRIASLVDPLALHVSPAEIRRRIGDIDDERKDVRHLLGLERLIQLVDRQMVGIHRDDVFRALGHDAREHADVAADVPRQVPVARAGHAHGRTHASAPHPTLRNGRTSDNRTRWTASASIAVRRQARAVARALALMMRLSNPALLKSLRTSRVVLL